MLAHQVITRFNLRLGFAHARDRLDAEWLGGRLEAFAELCHPSMLRQDAPHDWLVLLDAATPGEILERVRGLGGMTPVLLEPPHDLETVQRAAAEALPAGFDGHLITTRLDTDDALADGHLGALQSAFTPEPGPYFLNFPQGHMWHRRRLYACLDPASPFVSHVERVGRRPPQTAYRVAHVWAHRVAPVRQLWGRSMWLQLIADHNEVSVLDGVRSPRRRPPAGFRAHPALGTVDAGGRFAEAVRAAPGYLRRHRGRARYFRRNALIRSSNRPVSRA